MSKFIYEIKVYVAEYKNEKDLLDIAIKAQEYLKDKYPSVFNKILEANIVAKLHLLNNPVKPKNDNIILKPYLSIKINLEPIEHHKIKYLTRYLTDECGAMIAF